MSMMASGITSLTIVYWSFYSGTDQRKYQSSTSLAIVSGIHQELVNSPHKGPVMQKMFPFDDIIFIPYKKVVLLASAYSTNSVVEWIEIELAGPRHNE